MTQSSEVSIALPPRFQLETVLKESPSTAVYRVYDAIDRREVALKVLREAFTRPEELLQFQAEFSTLASLDHPGIVPVYSYGLLDEQFPYFTMEYFAGQKMSDFFHGRNWEAIYDCIVQIASALHHIHTRGIVHLDLKPSNVLVDDGGRVKIMDFGVAAESRKVFDRRIRGTLHYMAPEILRQDRIDSRADLYSLGMSLYETVTGALPGFGKPPIEVIRFHLDGEIRRPSLINPTIPEKLESIIMKLLERDPRHRYPTAAALLHDAAEAAGVAIPAGELLVGRTEILAAPLVGRQQQLEQIGRSVAEARDGHGGGIIVAGAEGMGKSRIVRDAALRAQLDGARVFTGRCPVNRKSIYAPFFEIFQQLVTALNPEADAIVEIRRILRSATSAEGDAAALGQKFRLYNRVVQSIQDFYGFLNAAGDSASPLILIVEDLQWSDPATAELFTFLVGEARHANLLVIGTLTLGREQEGGLDDGQAVAGSWEQRARESGIRLVHVGPLAEENVREYVESILGEENLPPELIRWILWESGGGPLAVRRVVDYLVTHGYVRSTPEGWVIRTEEIQSLRIPGGAASIWTEKLERVSRTDRELLDAAAVVGEQFDISILAECLDAAPESVYATVRALSAEGLLEEVAEGKLFSFPQVSLREAVYAQIPPRKRIELHRRSGLVLERMFLGGATELLGQVAYHFARGNEHVKGIGYSARAGSQASAALAHDQAAEFYRIALELMDLVGEEQRKPEIREKLGDAYYRNSNYRGAMQVYQFLLKSLQAKGDGSAGLDAARIMKKIGRLLAKRAEFDAALAYYNNAVRAYENNGELIDVAEMLNRIGWVHRDKGDFAEAEKVAQQAARLIDDLPITPVHGYIQNALGEIAFSRGDWDGAKPFFEKAREIAETTGSRQLSKVSSTNLGNVLWKLGEWDTALEYQKNNLAQSELEGDLWDLTHSYTNVGLIEFTRGHFTEAASLFEKSFGIAEKLGAPEYEAIALENLGRALEVTGRWSEASVRYEECVALDGFDEMRPGRVTVYIPMARLALKRGDLARALQYAQKAWDTAERARDENLTSEAAFVLAEIELERESYADAEQHLASAMALFERNATAHGLARGEVVSAELNLRQHRVEEAKQHAAEAIAIAERLGDRFTAALGDAIAGKALMYGGAREEGEERILSALTRFEELDTPWEQARVLFDLGLLKEDAEEATNTIKRAIRIFERLQASSDLERARGALYRIRPKGRPPETAVVGLYEIVKIINSTLQVEEVLNRVLDIVLKRLRAERGMIMLIDPITGELRTRVARNIREVGEKESKRSPQAVVREVIQTGQSIISADARSDDRFIDSETVISENIVSMLCVPLVIRERIAGAIYVDHRETRHLFSQRDLNFLEAFADQSAIAIENARLYEQLEQARLRLSLENESLRREVLVEKHLDSVVGESEVVARIQFTIRKASSSASTVLIRGESGTGKGLVARIVHNISGRRNGPFIKFNCAALPETLAESELFGHEKGSFTGADRRKLGRFELANGGTIFLDEIGKVSLAIQAKLLRVVEEKEFERVGGTQTIKTDVKIIAATNLDLERAIEEGTFREDLFYRLNIIPVVLPPLRDRKEDIPLLVEHFVRKISHDLGIEPKRLAPGILDLFATYDWPGNIRELEATLHRAIVMSTGDVLTRTDFYSLLSDPHKTIPDLPLEEIPAEILSPIIRRMQLDAATYENVLARIDRQLIEQALEQAGGKIRETARRLGVARNTLKAKIQRYGIVASDGNAE
jgi:Nif-specific regulatory protein